MCHQVKIIVSSRTTTFTFHSTNIQFMWHGHLQIYLQLKCVMSYIYMAQSFATNFMIKI
jgi:hypothetical protein